MKKQLLVFVLLCFAVSAVYGQRTIAVVPESPTTEQNCFPFGVSTFWTPYMGFVYKNIEAFTIQEGDRISFDLSELNDVPVQRDIYIARATTNGGTVPQQWVKLVDKFDVPLNARGNTIEGDYELSFTASARFVFEGGGLIIAFGDSPFEDLECNNVMPGTNSADVSGKFVGRFFNQNRLENGRSVFLDATFSTTSLAGFKLRLREDITPPVIKTKNITIYLDASGQATITPQDLDDGTYDSSGGVSLSIDKSTFTCTDVGLNTVMLTASDLYGNSTSAEVKVTVLDDTNPTVNTNNVVLQLDSFGRANVSVSQINNGSFDNCEIQEMHLNQTEFDCSHIGENVVTLTVRDASGNTASSTAVVTIQDTTAPTWGAPQDVYATVTTSCEIPLAIPTPPITDNCGDFEPGNALHFDGDNDFVMVPSTSVLNTQNQTQRTVEVFFRVENKSISTRKQVLWDEGNGDSGISIYIYQGALYMGAYSKEQNWQGVNHGVWLQNNNIKNGQWHQAVLVFDGTLPAEQRLKGYLDGVLFDTKAVSGTQLHAHSEINSLGAKLGKMLFHDGLDSTTETHNFRGDIDEIRLWTQARSAEKIQQFYTSQVNGTEPGLMVYYKIDEGVACGNNSGTKLLIDSSIYRLDGVVQGFEFSGAQGCVSNFTYGSPAVLSDLIIVNSVTGTSSASAVYPVGVTEILWTATDPSGNSSTVVQKVTVADVTKPVAITKDVVLYLSEQGQVSLTPEQVDNGSYDNCEIKSLSLSKELFTCENLGQQLVSLRVEDIYGNISSANATLTVLDTIAPILVGKSIERTLDASGTVTITPQDVLESATDNCTVTQLSISQATFDVQDAVNSPITIQLTAVDSSGNTTTVPVEVAIVNPAPEVRTQDVVLYLDENGAASLTPDQIDNGSSSVVGIASKTLDRTSFTCSDVGTTVVTLTITTTLGISASGTAVVTVVDAMPPKVVTQNITVDLIQGAVSITPSQIDNGSTDNCTIASMELSKSDFSCTDLGDNEVLLTVTDVHGNSASASAMVTVRDVTPPSLTTQDKTVYLDANGFVSITPQEVYSAAFDECNQPVTVSLSRSEFDCAAIGVNTVIVTATDRSGNSTTQNVRITVFDVTSPTLITKDITLNLNTSGQASITTNDVVSTATDNCSVIVTLNKTEFDCTDVGPNTVTITAVDPSGNTTTETAIVTIQDTQAPSLTTQNISVVLDANGQASISVNDIITSATDNCSVSLSLDRTQFDCSQVGENLVTVTGVDPSGNSSSATAIVTVQDITPPSLSTQDINVILNTNGVATITANDVVTSVNDNCAVTLSVDTAQFDCSTLGPNTISVTATDASGNTTTKTATVTVLDTTAPNLITKDINVVLNANGQASITPNDVVVSATDNCSLTLSLDVTAFDCADLGANTVTVTAIDPSGNVTTATALVTVVDTSAPSITPQNITLALDASGQASITPNDVVAASVDNCSVLLSIDKNQFDCSNLGSNTVTITATDASGNTSTQTATVTVVDVTPPNLITQDISIALNASGQASISVNDVVTSATDNCSVTMSLDVSQFDCTAVGPNTVTITATDGSGNTTQRTATVTVQDTTAPTLITKDISVNLDSNGQISITANDVISSAFDNCSMTVSVDISQFDCTNLGPNQVVVTAVDASGNTTTATATVTVQDTTSPIVTSKDITISLDTNGQASITANDVLASVTDNCSVSVSIDTTQFDCADLGTNIVMLTATDSSGNTTTVSASVTVQDTLAPELTVQNINVVLDSNGQANIKLSDVVTDATDNCSVSVSLDRTQFDCSHIGPNTVTITATDGSGNTTIQTAVVTVEDTTAPTLITKDSTLSLDANGLATITTNDVVLSAGDNCSVSLSIDKTQFDCADLGQNTITVVATDPSGNITTGTAMVTIQDTTTPVLTTKDIEISLDENGLASITANDVVASAIDNCSVSLSIDPSEFNCSTLGATIVKVTATDASGNTVTESAVVTVFDNSPPSLMIQDVTVDLDSNGQANIDINDVVVSASDNCSVSLSIDTTQFDCSDIGTNQVMVTAVDASGNTTSYSANVTIRDTTAPTLVTKDFSVVLNASGQATISVNDVVVSSEDNCSLTLSIDKSAFDCSNIGPNTVIVTATDGSGNTTVKAATVNVQDTTSPILITKDATFYLNANGQVSITANDVIESATDNCSLSLSVSKTLFDCTNIGSTQVTITATDASGNTSTGTATVTIQDVTPPTLTTRNITLPLDASGVASITANQLVNSLSDNCSVSVSIDKSQFDCSNLGANTVTLTATDASGNTTSETATVTVVDSTAPSLTTQNINVVLDVNGQASISANDLVASVSDNCNVSLSIDKNQFSCTNMGPNTVTITATDGSGNTTVKTATVTVQDTTAPILITKDATFNLDANGLVTITANDVVASASDNCSISLSIDTTQFDCSNIGVNTVTVTATDASGNTTSGTATVTIQDIIAPTVSPKNINITLNASGQASITPNDVVINATDNCSVSLSIDITEFDCSHLGPNTVTLTATDASGNTTIASATVTVLDTTPPSLTSQNYTITLDENGLATLNTNDVVSSVSDNCSVSVSVDKAQFTCANIGPNTVSITATDGSGNTTVRTAIVTVQDTTAPSLVLQDISRALNATGQISITANEVVASVSDNCSVTISVDQTQFDCSDLGPNIVTVTATDANGNSTSGTATVTIQDTTAPTLVTKNSTLQLDANGQVSLSVNDVVASVSDNCSYNISLDITQFDCSNIGPNTVTVTAVDASGNTTVRSTTVTIQDATAPSLIVQNVSVVLDANGQASITVNDVVSSATDNCSVSLSLNKTQFDCSNVGPNTVTITATDASGNTTIKNATVTVQDTTAPSLTVQDRSIILDANGQATISVNDVVTSVSDNCSVSVSMDTTQFDCSTIGSNTVTVTATDANGNSTIQTATITVQDTTNPTLVTKDATVTLDANGQATISINDVLSSVTDNCSVSVSIDISQFDCSNLGSNLVTLTATDASGNTTQQTATVTVQDTTAPSLTTQNIAIALDASGQASIAANDLVLISNDNCSVSVSLDLTQFDCSHIGTNLVTVTATDASGNSTVKTATVTVQDITPPSLTTQNISVSLDANGQASISTNDVVLSASDNCSVSLSISKTQFDCADIGANVVTITATDASGNTTQQNATVTIQDTTTPSVTTQDVMVVLDANGQASISLSDVVSSSSDNCAVSLSIDKSQFDCSNLGANLVTVTATDASGNTMQQTATVTVQDSTPPSLSTQDINVVLNANGQATISANDVVVSATDNCSVNVTLSKTQFDCTDVGTNIVTVTASDSAGNTTIQNVSVTVQDLTPPNLTTQSITVPLDANGQVQISLEDVSGAIQDNCSVASVSLSKELFTCADIGVNTVVITATDAFGNISTFNTQVTIVDTIAPVVSTKNISATLTNGLVTLVPSDVDNGSYDNCDVQLSLNRTQFTCDDIGTHTVQLTATDAAGNTSTASATVEILGDVPTITISDFNAVASQRENTIFLGYGPQSITLRTRARGGSGFTYEWTSSTGEVLDNVANPTISPVVGTTYTVTVTNSNGCTATASIDVCVLDVRSKNKFGDPDGRILICHRTGNSFNYVTLRVNYNNVEAHLLNHGDYLGACEQQECFTTQKQEPLTPQVTVYPNPTEGQFTVKLNLMSEQTTIQVLDLFGRVLLQKQVSSVGETNEFVFNPTNLKQGMYLVKVIMDGEIYTKSVIIQTTRK